MSAPVFSPTCLKGKVALVTGGGTGIGHEIARQIGLHGGCVMIMGRREKFLREAVDVLKEEGIDASYVVGDVRLPESAQAAVSATVKRFGSLSVLINGAAGNYLALANELTPKGFRTVMDIDANGTFNMANAAFPALKASNGGASIVNISATLHYGATRYQVHAAAAKAAVDSITRTLALEWGEHGIRVNGVAPGPIQGTPGMAKLAPGLKIDIASQIPVQRLGEKRDVALAVVYMCSDAASFVSGHTLVVDGGAWMYRPPLLPAEGVAQASRAAEAGSRAMVATKSKL